MPKKKNFLGGMQNYNPNNGEYEPDLTNSQGEPVKGFSNFKKSEEKDESFKSVNEKRMGKESSYQKYINKGYGSDQARMLANKDDRDDSEDERLQKIIDERIKQGWDSKGTYDPQAIKDLGYLGFGSLEELEKNTFGKKEEDNKEVGKIAKYSPFMRQADGTWKKDDTQQKRIKTLHNGLGIETKAQDKEHIYHEQVGKYRLIDVETGTTVGWAKDYDDALSKSQDQDFIGAINRAKKVFYEKHPELKEQPKEETKSFQPFQLDKKKYPDVEETPYGFIYNVNGHSITDQTGMRKTYSMMGSNPFGKTDPNRNYGFTVEIGGDEVYYETFDEAYKAAKRK